MKNRNCQLNRLQNVVLPLSLSNVCYLISINKYTIHLQLFNNVKNDQQEYSMVEWNDDTVPAGEFPKGMQHHKGCTH